MLSDSKESVPSARFKKLVAFPLSPNRLAHFEFMETTVKTPALSFHVTGAEAG